MNELWKPCSACKKPIAHGARWYKCSVSTCNSARYSYVFCSMSCWDAHRPGMNHRDNVWAEEQYAPRFIEAERRVVRPDAVASQKAPDEALIIASRLKDYIQAQAGFNTAGDVVDVLSDWVRELSADAIREARAEGRKTVMGRDFLKLRR